MTEPVLESLLGLREVMERLAALGTPAPPDQIQARWERLCALHGADLDFNGVAVVADRLDGVALRYAERGARTLALSEALSEPDEMFSLVVCFNLLHRQMDPLGLLSALHRLLASNGRLLVSSLVLDDPEASQFLRLASPEPVEWRLVPGPLAFRWLLHAAGFTAIEEIEDREGPREPFPVRDLLLCAAG